MQICRQLELDPMQIDAVHRALVLLRIVAETKIAFAQVTERCEDGSLVVDDDFQVDDMPALSVTLINTIDTILEEYFDLSPLQTGDPAVDKLSAQAVRVADWRAAQMREKGIDDAESLANHLNRIRRGRAPGLVRRRPLDRSTWNKVYRSR